MLRHRNLIALCTLLLAGASWYVLHRESTPLASQPVPTPSRVVMVPAHARVLAVVVTGQPSKPLERPSDIKTALFNPSVSFALRLQFVRSLGDDLPPAMIKSLLDYLHLPAGQDGLGPISRNALKNDVIVALRKQRVAPAGLTQELISIYRDKNEDPVMRDYAIQHLSEWRTNHPVDIGQIDPIIWEAAGESDQTSGATALLALARIADDQKAAGHAQYAAGARFEKIQALAQAMATNRMAPLLNRLTALGVSSQLGGHNAVTLALDRLNDTEPVVLQFVALESIRKNYDAHDPATLARCVAAVDSRLSSPDETVSGSARTLANLLKSSR